MIVAKFGGSSLAGGEEMSAAALRLGRGTEAGAVVVSAGGKKNGEKKITDLLIEAYGKISRGEDVRSCLMPFLGRVSPIVGRLKLKVDCMEILEKIERGFAYQPTLSFLASRGEAVWAELFSAFTGYPLVDAADVMRFGKDGKIDLPLSFLLIREKYREVGRFVTGGFYGADGEGRVLTLSRGGGDYTGAVVAGALRADAYYNFTDVDGFFDSDPKLNFSAKILPEISFEAARRLGEFGAGVLHPDSVLPLVGTGIPVIVRNTFREGGGTRVSERCGKDCPAVASVKGCFYLRLRARGRGREFLSEAERGRAEGVRFFLLSFNEDWAEMVGKSDFPFPAEGGLFAETEREESVSPVRLLYCPSAVLGKKFSDKLCEKGIFPLVERHAKDGSLIAVREENGKAAELACCEILSLNMSAF